MTKRRAWNSTCPAPAKPIPRSGFIKRSSPAKSTSVVGTVPYSTIPKQKKRPKASNPKRRAKEFARCYHSVERVEWVKARPCQVCLKIGVSENAHTIGGGAGRKAGYETIAALCGRHQWADEFVVGCHGQLHALGPRLFQERYRVDLAQLAATLQAKWRAHLNGET